MMVTTRQHYIVIFGIPQAFTLGAVLIAGACLVWPVQLLPFRALNSPAIDITLWIVEAVLYVGIALFFSRNAGGAIAGLVLGYIIRLAANALIFLLVSLPLADLFVFGGERGLLHALAVVIALLALSLSFRPLLVNIGLPQAKSPVKNGSKTRVAFDNRQLPTSARQQAQSRRSPGGQSEEVGEIISSEQGAALHPPADFNPILPREDVAGTLTIQTGILLDSVPEAKSILAPNYGISIRLAYIVPQLPRGTVWLTWRQVFEKGVPPMETVDTTRLEQQFINRWIRLSPRQYITQVPAIYFEKQKTTPAWMKLPAIEQEAEITFES